MKKKYLISVFLISAMPLFAWDDHPDNDQSRRDEGCGSTNSVESSYDWSKRDPDSKDSASTESQGTTIAPDRDK